MYDSIIRCSMKIILYARKYIIMYKIKNELISYNISKQDKVKTKN